MTNQPANTHHHARLEPHNMHHHQHGFTLVELMLVLTIAAMVAGIAYPSYTQYVLRSHRSHAQAQMLQAAHWMERAALTSGRYPTQAQHASALESLSTQLGSARYAIRIQSTDGSSFVITATPHHAQSQDPCGSLTLNQAGQRGVSAQPPNSLLSVTQCWHQ